LADLLLPLPAVSAWCWSLWSMRLGIQGVDSLPHLYDPGVGPTPHTPKSLKKLVRRLNGRGNPVKHTQMDNAGELKKFTEDYRGATEECLRKIQVKHANRDSPQFNGKVERKITVITRQIKSALNAARLAEDYCKALWGEAVMNLTDIENVLMSRSYSAPACVTFFEQELQGMKNFRQFGEVTYVKFGDKMKGKLANRGVPMICLGHSRDHAADSC